MSCINEVPVMAYQSSLSIVHFILSEKVGPYTHKTIFFLYFF